MGDKKAIDKEYLLNQLENLDKDILESKYVQEKNVKDTYTATDENPISGKGVSAAVNTLQQNFQAGVDGIYNAIVAEGTTPASKTQSDVKTGIKTLSTNRYNDGIKATKKGTAVADDVLTGKTFTNSSGVEISGTMTNNGAVTKTLDTTTTSYTVPKGYHNGNGTVSITTQTKTATPSTSSQTISPDSGKVLSSVTVSAMSNGSLNNAATAGVTYTENTAASTVIPSEGALYINAGYMPNTKITLGHMIPDPETGKINAGAAAMRTNYVAYDKDGKKIIGTMANVTPSFTGGGASLTGTSNTISTNMTTATSGDYYIDATAKAKATRTAVTYNGAATGYINVASGTSASAANTSTEGSITATRVYIPKATTSKTNGTASATATAGTGSEVTAPSASASLTRTGNIGTTTKPSGTDGTDYWTFTSSASANSGVVKATGGSASASVTASSATVGAGYNPSSVTASTTASSTGTKTGTTYTSTAKTASNSSSVYLTKSSVPNPTISIDSAGKITASSTHTAGYNPGGTASNTKQMTTQTAKTVTPTTSSQTAVASGTYCTGAITVGAIPSDYIKPSATKGATTITPTSSSQTAVAAGTYCSGAITVSAVPTEVLNAGSSTAGSKTYTPAAGKFFSSVVVAGVSVPNSSLIAYGSKVLISSSIIRTGALRMNAPTFYVAPSTGSISYSTSGGATWESTRSTGLYINSAWGCGNGIGYGETSFMIAGNSASSGSSQAVKYSDSDNGIAFHNATTGLSHGSEYNLYGSRIIKSLNGTPCFGGNYGRLYYLVNGLTSWSYATKVAKTDYYSNVYGITYGNGLYITCGGHSYSDGINAGIYYSSSLSSAVTAAVTSTSNLFRDAVYASGRFFVTTGSTTVYTSTNGKNWSTITAPASIAYVSYGCGKTLFFPYPSATSYYYIKDGTTSFVTVNAGFAIKPSTVFYDGISRFYCLSYDGKNVLYNRYGVNAWSALSTFTTAQYLFVCMTPQTT